MLPNLRKSGHKIHRLPMAIVKNKATFRAQTSMQKLNGASSQPEISQPLSMRRYSNKPKLKTVSLQRRGKKKAEKKQHFMGSLKSYMELLKRRKFKNVDINDVNALRASCKVPEDKLTDYSEVDNADESSEDSIKGLKHPNLIQIGNLEDQEIAQAQEIFKQKSVVRRRDESEPFDNFLKN